MDLWDVKMINRRFYFYHFVIIFSLLIFLSGCSGLQSTVTPTEDTLYLTPMPQSTLDAAIITALITTKLQAVIAARRELGTTRLEFSAPPSVLSIEKMNLADAYRAAGFTQPSASDLSGETSAWLIIFEGDFRIVPPDPMHTFTPGAPGHGCAAVIIVANGGVSGGAGTLTCPTPQ